MLASGAGWTALSPYPAYAAAIWDEQMRIPIDVIDCVVFVGVENGGKFTPIGTGFIGGVPYEGMMFRFLVTARHVLDDHEAGKLAIRLNRRSGGCESVPLNNGRYTFPDPAIDVVLVSVDLSPEIYDYWTVKLDRPEWQQVKTKILEPAPGDEVATVGLYSVHHGLTRNLPVVRTGHIAALPGEPVRTGAGHAVAYLVELHSILGLSGSPVFLNVPPVRNHGGTTQFLSGPVHIIIGVQVGYHLVDAKEDQILVPEQQGDEEPIDARTRKTDELRTGFSVVIPIERVFDLVEDPLMKDHMAKAFKAYREGSGYRPSGLKVAPTTAAESAPSTTVKGDEMHRERFTALLDEALGKPKQGD